MAAAAEKAQVKRSRSDKAEKFGFMVQQHRFAPGLMRAESER
jgi:hypothetical protein